ncbi:MAG: tripartite tricarboxylate transporter TctB family protein [Ornithinimicrobium sp.]
MTAPTEEQASAVSPHGLARRRTVLTYVTGAAVIIVGVAAAVGSKSLGYWTDLGPGPGFFPLCLGVLLATFGTAWVLSVARTSSAATGTIEPASPAIATSSSADSPASGAETRDAGAADDGEEYPEYSVPTVIAIIGSLVLLAATLEILGYQIAMLLFLLFHLLVLGRRRLLLSLVIAVGGSIGVFVVFTRLLTVPLPASTIPFLRDLGF